MESSNLIKLFDRRDEAAPCTPVKNNNKETKGERERDKECVRERLRVVLQRDNR